MPIGFRYFQLAIVMDSKKILMELWYKKVKVDVRWKGNRRVQDPFTIVHVTEKVVRVAEEEEIAVNRVLKEAKHSDDIELSLWKQELRVSDRKMKGTHRSSATSEDYRHRKKITSLIDFEVESETQKLQQRSKVVQGGTWLGFAITIFISVSLIYPFCFKGLWDVPDVLRWQQNHSMTWFNPGLGFFNSGLQF
ncbi:hypothetical protein OUZ56_002669 [Daphnia magna]|uniref:Uncharacterized protein n=1 Tax=Daphnia magna TaxID=35525 RepID=A0ABR0A6N4_9CRUS|nr:hypothetical protein OUZ56_002669 [Daphnia magna]